MSVNQTTSISLSVSACAGCHLITGNEWLTITHNLLNVASNWSSGAVGGGYIYSGHNDNAPANSLAAGVDSDSYNGTGQTSGNQRRTLTLSNGQVIWDISGNVYEWTQEVTTGSGRQPGLQTDSSYISRAWSTSNLRLGGFTSSHPGFGSPTGVTWNSSNGVGSVWSSGTEDGIRAIRRGGTWNNGGAAGVLALDIYNGPNVANGDIGFRVAR